MINIFWHKVIPNTLHIEVTDMWTWDELKYAVQKANAAVRARHAAMRVDFIIDLDSAAAIPNFDLRTLYDIADVQLPSTGIVTIVSHKAYSTVMFSTATGVCYKAAHYFKLVPTLYHAEEAVQIARTQGEDALLA